MKKILFAAMAAALSFATTAAQGQALAKDYFGHVQNPSGGKAQSIGSYAQGCIAGAETLPETGPTWQAMRLSRNRNHGHPVLIDFVKDLSKFAATQEGFAGLYIGDMSQPRGGPMLSGHASHQIGLDADIWALAPKRLNLSRNERENISSVSLVTDDFKSVNGNFTQAHYNILKKAASDPRVARIFITPAVKLKICDVTSGNPDWLGKLRPWWGHNYHFHVRLKCPSGSSNCKDQWPVEKGDGCDHAREFYGMHITKTIPLPKNDNKDEEPKKPVVKNLDWLPKQCAALVK